MYAKSGSIDDARQVFNRTEMVGALAQHGCGFEALEVFKKWNSEGVKPNVCTFVAVLSACMIVMLAFLMKAVNCFRL